jgi:Cu(I)/Ag(I) efflux system membrane protein CusA/SilA
LPKGVEIVPTYDRSAPDRARGRQPQPQAAGGVSSWRWSARCSWHLRSALVAIISLPLGMLAAFIVMHWQGVNANIMSLGGIAIAIGAMVDAAVVMIENAHKHLERWRMRTPDEERLEGDGRWQVIGEAAAEVGPALFFSLLIITLSFHPGVHAGSAGGPAVRAAGLHQDLRDGRGGRLSVTLIPVLMGYLIRGRIPGRTAAIRSTAG